MLLKKRIKAYFGKWPGFGLVLSVYRVLRLLRSPQEAGRFLRTRRLLSQPPRDLFQPYGNTHQNRYPRVFRKMQELLEDGPERLIVSFGCSTGEEVFSLRRYFARTQLLGLDINPHSVRVCQSRLRRNPDWAIRFAVAGSTANLPDAGCDAILAMAIFRHGDLNQSPFPPSCEPHLLFIDFEAAMVDFTRCLRPGGLLVLRYAMFRFSDTCVAALYESVLSLEQKQPVPLYSRENSLLPVGGTVDVIFRKLPTLEGTRE
jgi:SAM-dependent methyltransferase